MTSPSSILKMHAQMHTHITVTHVSDPRRDEELSTARGGEASAVHCDALRELSLFDAIRRRDAVSVDRLLAHNVNVNQLLQPEKLTPLMVAALSVQSDSQHDEAIHILRLLLQAGADPNISRVDDGYTALIYACHQGHVDAVALLLEAGADATYVTELGWGPLFTAQESRSRLHPCRQCRSSQHSVELLVERGAKIDATNCNGFSPLVVAAMLDDTVTARHLLRAGATVRPSLWAKASHCLRS